ncbi:MAG: LuxR C-terminal-related transcriptional regulator [Paludibacteraceae bacterium]|nr:LuxR C-terminal-related transcriptional regulator [Paludibacteraceae bacterium]
MYSQKIYESSDKMIMLIKDNYNVLQSLGCFGINLGFEDKTVEEVCKDNDVDTYTFLTVVNFTMNGSVREINHAKLSVDTLMRYLKASHTYYLGFQLPFIRRELTESLSVYDPMAKIIIDCYDEYASAVTNHMKYEEENLFPYVEALLRGERNRKYSVADYERNHTQTDLILKELKTFIIQYLPPDKQRNNQLMATLYDIYNNQEWLALHAKVEDAIFAPAIELVEKKLDESSTTNIFGNSPAVASEDDDLSEREIDVVKGVVLGLSNKEIAENLCISTNTVITHRRNIAKKLDIHSAAGLTVYAIVHKLVDVKEMR